MVPVSYISTVRGLADAGASMARPCDALASCRARTGTNKVPSRPKSSYCLQGQIPTHA